MSITIKGNGHAIPIIYFHELTNKEQDYWKDLGNFSNDLFFRYRNHTYSLSEFTRPGLHDPEWIKKYDGYTNDSFFSGVAINIIDEGNAVKAFTFFG